MKPKKILDQQLDFQRAMILLYKRFNTVDDFLTYWHFAGPCKEPHPSIEDI